MQAPSLIATNALNPSEWNRNFATPAFRNIVLLARPEPVDLVIRRDGDATSPGKKDGGARRGRCRVGISPTP